MGKCYIMWQKLMENGKIPKINLGQGNGLNQAQGSVTILALNVFAGVDR